MAGEARTNKFLIGEATVMVGPLASAFQLNPTAHSIGLVKNLAIKIETGSADLTQGIENVPIFSVQNQFDPMVSCEVYEYTARNLAYGMGLDASGATFDEPASTGPFTLASAINAGATSVVLTTGQGTNFNVGDWVLLQQSEDVIHAARVTAKATDTLTISAATPTGVTFATATTRVFKARDIKAIGGQTNFLSVKANVILPRDARPVSVIFPKVRITRGFDVQVGTQDYSNLPFEFKPYPLVSTDALFSSFDPGEVFKIVTE